MIVMQERHAPSRPYGLGTQRRRAPKGARSVGAGGRALAGRRAPSLDTDKYLATSVARWIESLETAEDKDKKRWILWGRVCSTVYKIWQGYAEAVRTSPNDGAEWRWWNAYETEWERVRRGESEGFALWLTKYLAKKSAPDGGPPAASAYLHTLYLESWKRRNPPNGRCRKALNWEKQYFQLLRCQGEFIAYEASCCPERTEQIAVPIGCNHRLCPLCNSHRSENAQRRVRKQFDRINHPIFLTLTVPNVRGISKRTFAFFRKKLNQFLADHAYMLDEPGRPGGGVYSIEATYNREEKSWHVHAHILVSANFKLPAADQKFEFAGRTMRAFDYVKLALEYDWSRVWCSQRQGWMWGSKTRALAEYADPNRRAKELVRWRAGCDSERLNFEMWVREAQKNRIKVYNPISRTWVTDPRLSSAELKARTKWNTANRRVMWIKPVDDRRKAAEEVLKYITKSADFIDDAECVVAFQDATRGARMIQTFGSWYGIDFAIDFDTRHPEDWSKLECSCGSNHWERRGVVRMKDVRMQTDGRYRPLGRLTDDNRWQFGRPRIRALHRREHRNGDQVWTH